MTPPDDHKPVEAGQTYVRNSGPPFRAEVVTLSGEQAMCRMFFSGNWHFDLRPIPCSLLRSGEFDRA